MTTRSWTRAAIPVAALALAACHAARPEPLVPAGAAYQSRTQWGARAPVSALREHTPDRITIHHTATPQAPDRPLADKMRALQRFSQGGGLLGNGQPKVPWADVPYHFYIAVNGEIAEGRELRYVGDSNTPYDPTGHLLIVLEGNFEHEDPPPAQLAALRQLVQRAAERWHIAPERIGGHRDHASTRCPGERLYQAIPSLRTLVTPIPAAR
ncbi:MAG TPA: peptidoglycan recognition family protein [Gemmatimonadaceae bacterium]|nr:peptidoglycan recognition family protein [Gemmatimonadaceae bacterium]